MRIDDVIRVEDEERVVIGEGRRERIWLNSSLSA